jgi:hypothetical protein
VIVVFALTAAVDVDVTVIAVVLVTGKRERLVTVTLLI